MDERRRTYLALVVQCRAGRDATGDARRAVLCVACWKDNEDEAADLSSSPAMLLLEQFELPSV